MRYYSTQRPVGPGTFPQPEGNKVVELHNFDSKTYCEEISREAWGYIDYEQALSPEQAASYELAPAKRVAEYIVHHPPEYREHGFAVRPWHYQLAKLLDCWLYQTAEDATYKDPLRLAMKEFRDNLYSFIVGNSPDYTAAPWGELPAQSVARSHPPIFHINTAPGEAMAQKGHASYPEDFPHLKPGETFTAWRVEDGWEVETTLDGAALMERLEAFRRQETDSV
jgi:hypothetical protein